LKSTGSTLTTLFSFSSFTVFFKFFLKSTGSGLTSSGLSFLFMIVAVLSLIKFVKEVFFSSSFFSSILIEPLLFNFDLKSTILSSFLTSGCVCVVVVVLSLFFKFFCHINNF